MPHKSTLVACFLCALVPAAAGLAAPADKPATQPAEIPDQTLQQLDQLFRLTQQPKSQQEYVKMIAQQMGKVLQAGEKIEAQHPAAPNLHLVHVRMLMAADFLTRVTKGSAAYDKRLEIARKLKASDAPAGAKVTADFFVTMDAIAPPGGKPAEDASKRIKAYVSRYVDTDAEAPSLIRATQMAQQSEQDTLETQYLDKLSDDYATEPTVNAFLLRAGRNPPFVAEVTLLDGKTLTLPKDLLGKVVVVDFWATWCQPCVASLPHMKEVYATYKDKGVEFLGISLDKPDTKEQVQQFVKNRELNWLHAYSGKFWNDPTARRYGVRGIPSVWVIGKDGRIVSNNARGDLEATINRALAQPAPKKAGAAKAEATPAGK